MLDPACQLSDGTLVQLLRPAYWVNCLSAFDSAIGIIVGAIISVIAWLAKVIVSGLAVQRTAANRRRDILLALSATVAESQDGYAANYSPKREKDHCDRIDADQEDSPFTITAPADFLLEKVKKEIDILPARIVSDTTRYIYAVEYLDAASAAFMSAEFKALQADRKKGLVAFTFTTGRETAILGARITTALETRRRRRKAWKILIAVAICLGGVLLAQRATAATQTSGGTGLRITIGERMDFTRIMTRTSSLQHDLRRTASTEQRQYRVPPRIWKGLLHATSRNLRPLGRVQDRRRPVPGRRRCLAHRRCRSEILAIVGESGSGKSVAMLAVMGLLPWTATVTAKTLAFDGQDLLRLTPRQRRRLVGKDMAMIFQEPMSSLNPCFTVGFQIGESLKAHLGLGKAERRAALDRTAGRRRHSRSGTAAHRLPAPAFRRHEPARHDRHGARLPAQADHRRRADHGARRHHPGADPRTAGRAAAGDRHGPRPDHA